MPALNEKDYAEFSRMLEELEPEVDNMKETPKSFMSDMIAKNKEYGERVFVSPKQLNWIKSLHEEYVGDTAHETTKGPDYRDPKGVDHRDPRSDRDMDDDTPF